MAVPRSLCWLISGIVAAVVCTSLATAQSFDCARAHYIDEKTVCREPALRQLDSQLASVYRRLMLKLPPHERVQLDTEEETFVVARRHCAKDHGCIEQSYRKRILELDQALSREAGQTN